jgi:hypothetical protein
MSNRGAKTITLAAEPACINNWGLTFWIADGIDMLPERSKARAGAIGDVGEARPKRMHKKSAVAEFNGKHSLFRPDDESSRPRA